MRVQRSSNSYSYPRLTLLTMSANMVQGASGSETKRRYGEKNSNWKGGIIIENGYHLVMAKWHPRADNDGYIFEHILLMEQKLGRRLEPGEVVHHVNGIRSDNREENLALCPTQGDHMRLHHPMIDMSGRICCECGTRTTYTRRWYRAGTGSWKCHKCYKRK
jgi:HNH endonuclease